MSIKGPKKDALRKNIETYENTEGEQSQRYGNQSFGVVEDDFFVEKKI